MEGEVAAYPFSRLERNRLANGTVGGKSIVILFETGTLSALDRSSIADSREIGAALVFSPSVDGRKLRFTVEGHNFKDAEAGSSWDIFGKATSGPLKGRSLPPILGGNHFWFVWAEETVTKATDVRFAKVAKELKR